LVQLYFDRDISDLLMLNKWH